METNTIPPGLVVTGASKNYGATRALVDVDLEVHPGEVVALLGENGAGKSTISSIIAGVTQPSAGTMTWKGQPYSPANPGEAIDQGIGLIHQEMRLLPDLTVAENVMIGRWPTRGGMISRTAMAARAEQQLSKLGFTGSMNQLVRELSVAGQQQVEIAKALMLNARLLILDEPTAALGQAETDALFERVRALQSEGVSFIYVSHRLAEIALIATRIVVLRDGRKVAEHLSADIHPDRLVEQMVGRSIERLFPHRGTPSNDLVLRVDNISSPAHRFEDISFDVHAGEIFGIAGIVGAGRTEVVRAIAGADPVSTGTVSVDGNPVPAGRPSLAIKQGIVLVPEDRKSQGLIIDQSIEGNIALANFNSMGTGGWLGSKTVSRIARSVAERLGVKGRMASPASSLSGGNQQKVVIGKWLERNPRVVILDEPTRGIDVGARSAIYEVIVDLAAAGAAVVVVSSDLDEVLGLSHRVMVLARGRNQGIMAIDDASASTVMALAVA